jgi:hypothetical protein
MFTRGHRTAIFIVSMFILLLLKDLLAKLIITDSKTGAQDPSHGKRFQNESL